MDFDPEHPKWSFCCCHLAQGLIILAGSEIVLSVLLLLCSIAYIALPNPDEQHDNTPWFMIILMLISIMYGVTSALLILGINKYKEKLMYPTLIARTIIIIFMQVFGVSAIVRPSHVIDDVNWKETIDLKMHKNLSEKKMQNEPSVVQRLVLFIFVMIILLIFVFYTLYLIVRCINYVKAYNRLLLRKRSLLIACHIDLNEQQRSLNS